MIELIKEEDLPRGFVYPKEFLQMTDQGLINFEPWIIMSSDYLYSRYNGLKQRYNRTLIPFARRIDNDDIACWSPDFPKNVFIVHDFASAGWEERKVFSNLWEWLKYVVDEMIDYNE